MKRFRAGRLGHAWSLGAVQRLSMILATAGGAGYSAVAPGTVGALLVLPVGFLIADLGSGAKLAIVLLISVGAIIAIHPYLVWTGVEDPQEVVLDEVVGCLTALAFVPWEVPSVVAAFVLFRLFDIYKPWPIRSIELVRGGIGVVCDDVAAGVLAGALVFGVRGLLIRCGLL